MAAPTQIPELGTVENLFVAWRAETRPRFGSGLAWYLSNEICRRYYRSHGIAPFVMHHGGLGYYGIELAQLPCRPTGLKDYQPLGRLTIAGNVENWGAGTPGDHGCGLAGQCAAGVTASAMVTLAIRHLGLPAMPAAAHKPCHHKRRGDSFVLLWEIATILALRNDLRRTDAYLRANGLEEGKPFLGLDGPPMTYRKPGHFWFGGNGEDVYVTDEGALCDGSGENLWLRYMAGESPADLATWIEERVATRAD